jgi:hypothetical protein
MHILVDPQDHFGTDFSYVYALECFVDRSSGDQVKVLTLVMTLGYKHSLAGQVKGYITNGEHSGMFSTV